MRKFIKFILSVLLIFAAFLLIIEEKRRFYCLAPGKYVTVWKRIGGYCLIIPNRYFGLTSPWDNYIYVKTNTDLALIWMKDSNRIIADFTETDFKIYNNNKKEMEILSLSSQNSVYDSLFFGTTPIAKTGESKPFYRISILVKESYAIDEDGNRY